VCAIEVLADRYELVRQLGSGAYGEVYEAHDRVLGATVALKRLRHQSADALLHIKGEFRALAGIRHPGLVRLFDLVVAGDEAFFTMERVHGVRLTEYAHEASPVALASAVRSAADAIEALHARGKLHRDLKPDNVLVGARGEAQILDFGFVAHASATAGTLAYMAPEAFEGAAPSPASDWYGLGVLVYEALTGRVPASARDLAESVLRKRTRRFPRPRELRAGVSAELDDLVWSLLEPIPAKRAGHDAIVRALPFPQPASREGRGGGRPVELFGRDRELARMQACLERAEAAGPCVVLVEGESGTGKTALIESFFGQAATRGWTTLAGAARPQEWVPFLAIDAIVDEILVLVRSLPGSERAEIVARIPPTLARSFPVLASLDAARLQQAPAGMDALEARHEAQSAFASLVRSLCTRRPVALWIDDLQWADQESLVFLRGAIEQAQGARLLVALTRRPGPLPWPDHEAWLAVADRLSLGPLDDSSAQRLLRRHAGRETLSDSVESRALREAGGNAFLLELLARHAAARPEPDRQVDVASALHALLDDLDADARVLFECAALTQQALPLACLGHVLADRSALRVHADRLVSGGLISVDPTERVRPYHDTLRERTEATLDAESLRARHGALARALEEYGGPAEWSIPHLEACGRTAEAASKSVEAGRTAAERYAFEIAARHYENALRLGAFAGGDRARILGDLANNLALAGRGPEAADRYDDGARLLEDEGRTSAAFAMRHHRAVALLRSGRIAEGTAALGTTLRAVGESLPRSGAPAMLASGVELLRLTLARRRSPGSEDVSPGEGVERRLEALWTSATSLSMYDPLVANVLTLRFARYAGREGGPRWGIRALALEAAFLAALGGHRRAEANRVMAELRRRSDDAPWPYERAWIAATEGSTAWLGGDLPSSCDWTARARGMFQRVPETGAYEFALLDAFRVPALARTGRSDEALQAAVDTLSVAHARGDRFAALPCQHGHVTLAYLSSGDRAAAETRAEEGRRTCESSSSGMTAYHQVWSRVTLALFDGDGAGALALLRAGWRQVRRAGMLRIESVAGDLRYLRALCALAASGPARGRRRRVLLRDADSQRRWLRSSSLRLGGAVASSIEIQLALASGRTREAQHAGDAAIGELEAVGLRPDAGALARRLKGGAAQPCDRLFVPV
jgi:tRNA A-37 threonylcarbamoyl transferase component Bud32